MSGVIREGRAQQLVLRPCAAAPAILYDFRPITRGDDAERPTVRATWTHGPTSWGVFFLGWRAPGILIPILADLGPASHLMSLGVGIHDEVDEGPTDGAITRRFTLDLHHFPALRGEGVTFEAGAGTQGMAANGAYRVGVVVERRTA